MPHGSTGMTVAKLMKIRTKFKKADVDMKKDPVTIVISVECCRVLLPRAGISWVVDLPTWSTTWEPVPFIGCSVIKGLNIEPP
jgi:hypothetical protein